MQRWPLRQPVSAAGLLVAGRLCTTASDCCGTEAFGSRPDCVTGADGGGFCRFAQVGQACDSTRHCAPGVPCVFPVVDAGVDAGMDAGVDAGPDDAGLDDGGADAGEDDGGVDAGAADAGTVEPVGVCTRPSTTATCTLLSQTCNPGDSCNPNSATNQGYDPCFYRVVQNRLSGRSPVQVCEAGRCGLPAQGDPCSQTCSQTPGDPRRTVCTAGYDNDPLCMPACTTDTDCRGANTYDSNLQNPQPITNLCVRYGNASACQPALCFVDGSPNFGNPNVLYKPCVGHPNTVCLPRFVGSNTALLGFCMAARPGGAPTVGQTCDPRAGVEATAATCGADATCLGGRCAAICDASQLGGAGTPACPSDQTCVSPQGLDLVTSYQFGGCADPCNPFTDLANSGCVNYCGGSSARCNWIIGDPKVGEPRGVCGAAVKAPIPTGGECTRDPLDPCESGNFCLLSSNGVTRTCTRLCDPIAVAGAPDACPTGQSCTAFASFTRSGYCR